MRQGIGLVLVLVLLLIGAGVFVVTAVSLTTSMSASAATLSGQPPVKLGAPVWSHAEQTQPADTSVAQPAADDQTQDVTFSQAAHQGYCDGDTGTSSAGY